MLPKGFQSGGLSEFCIKFIPQSWSNHSECLASESLQSVCWLVQQILPTRTERSHRSVDADKVTEIPGGCTADGLVHQYQQFVSDSFMYRQPVQLLQNRCNMLRAPCSGDKSSCSILSVLFKGASGAKWLMNSIQSASSSLEHISIVIHFDRVGYVFM